MRADRTVSPTHRSRQRLRRSAIGVAVLNLTALALTQPVQAMDAYWAGGEGSWTNGAAWVDGLVPTRGTPVWIDNNPAINSTVWVDSAIEAPSVVIDARDALKIRKGSIRFVGHTLNNNGVLEVQGSSTTGSATLILDGDTSLLGFGSTVLAGGNYSFIDGRGSRLTIRAGHTLRGAGVIGGDSNINVVNQGTVIAQGGVLRVSPGTGRSFNNAGGKVTVADGATLRLDSGSLSGGTITGQGAARLTGGGIFRDVQLAGPLQIAAGTSLLLAGTITNTGTLTVLGSPTAGSASLNLAGDTTLAGSGSTVLTNGTYSYVYGAGHTLTIGEGQTLRGVGYIGADGNINLVNRGVVIAEGGVLRLALGTDRSFNNVAGTVTVADGATLQLDSGTLSGGVLNGQGSAQLAGSGTFDSTRLTGTLFATSNSLLKDSTLQGELQVAAGGSLRLAGTLTNTGTLKVLGSATTGGASLNLAGDTTLAGSGSTVLTNGTYSYVYGAGHTLTVGEGQTLRGVGHIGADGNINIVNRGAVIAEGGVLRVALGTDRSFNNVAGTVTVADGATLRLDSGTLSGGVLNGQGSAKLTGSGVYRDLQLKGSLQVDVGTSLNVAGTLTNTGTLTVQGSATTGSASLNLAGDTTLAGAGSTVLTNGTYSQLYGAGHTLTIAEGHTLRGVGYIGADGNINLVNRGAVIAEGGVLRVALGEGRSFNNAGGTVTVADGATLRLDSGTLSGGVVNGQGSAQLAGSGTYDNTQLTGRWSATSNSLLKDSTLQGELQVVAGGSLRLAGTLTNTGTLKVLGSPTTGSASLNLAGDTTLAGAGSTVLTNGTYSQLYGAGHTLTIAEGQTLRGAGYIGADGNINLVNRGAVIAEGGVLRVAPGEGRSFNNAGGTVTVADGATLRLDSGTLTGGVLNGQGGAQLAGSGTFDSTRLTGTLSATSNSLLKDSTLQGELQVVAGGSLRLAGTLTNTGTLTVLGSPTTGSASLNLAGDTTLAGAGSTVLTNGTYSQLYGAGHTLTIAEGHTLRGPGRIGADGNINVVNQGSLIAEGGRLTVQMQAGQSFDNTTGLIRVDDTGQILLYGDLLLGDASQLVFDVADVGGQAAWGGLSWYAPATFDGTLRLNFDGYTPTVGQQFSLIQYSGSYSGAFDAALADGYTLSLSYADNLVVATVTGVSPVPEPGTWALWLAGAAALGAVVRRRSRQDWV